MTKELEVAVSLLFEPHLEVDFSQINISRLISLLNANKVPVAVLPSSATLGSLLLDKEFASYYHRECNSLARTLTSYHTICDAWRKENVRPVLIKSTGTFPYTSDNIDVLVHPAQKTIAERVLI